MNFWGVIWIFLMMTWLFGMGFYSYGRSGVDKHGTPIGGGNPLLGFGITTLIPWACVAILGAGLLGGITLSIR